MDNKILSQPSIPVFVLCCPKVLQSCTTVCNPVDCSLPGSSVHGILPTRILEYCHASLQGIFLTQDWTQISHIAGVFYTSWTPREATSGNVYPLQYSGLENSMDSSTWGHKESDTTEWLSLSACHICKVPILFLRWKHCPPPAKTVYNQCFIISIFSLLTY